MQSDEFLWTYKFGKPAQSHDAIQNKANKQYPTRKRQLDADKKQTTKKNAVARESAGHNPARWTANKPGMKKTSKTKQFKSKDQKTQNTNKA